MKFPHYFPILVVLALILPTVRLSAQGVDTSAADTPPPGSTVVTSDELRMDQESHTAVFTGNVLVTGSNFNMKCQQMTVIFTKDSKVDNILAKGDVVIEQPGRITHSGQAQYFREEDKFVLTDQPTILDNKNQISAPKIVIFRTKQSLLTEGRTKTTLVQDVGGPTPSNSTNK